jgi:hypothetical protein
LAAVALGVVGVSAVVTTAAPAGADVIDPAGKCFGSGVWTEEGETRDSTMYVPSDTVEIPQADTVHWTGNIQGFTLGQLGPRREISGEVQLDIMGLGDVPIDDWGGSSERYANEGDHEYDLPSVLINVKMKLEGEHREAPEGSSTFTRICGGSVYVQIEGSTFSNPLAIAAIPGLALSLLLLVWSGFRKVAPAFEDTNPG